MKVLSAKKLAQTVLSLRSTSSLTQEELGRRTGLHRIMIGRVERGDYIPSISQLEALAATLGFEITDMFVEEEQPHTFLALRSESLNDHERQGVDHLLSMMFSLRQQYLMRSTYEHVQEDILS